MTAMTTEPQPEIKAAELARRPRGGLRELGGRLVSRRSHLWPILVFVSAILVLWARPVLGDFGHLRLSNPGDSESFAFYLSWNVHAVANLMNPFFTPNLYAPGGLDLGNAISIPSVSLLVAPISAMWGGTAAYNAAVLISILLGALSVYLFARELTGSVVGSTMAGLLMVVAPYFVGHGLSHLNLMWIFGAPLIGYLLVRYAKHRLRWGWLVGWTALVLAFTGGASTELLVTETIFVAVGLVVAIIFGAATVRRRLLRATIWLAVGGGIAAIILIPVVLAALRAGIPDAVENSPALYSTELTNLVVPTRLVRFGWIDAYATVSQTWVSNTAESTAFIGIPLLVFLGVYAFAVRGQFPLAVASFGVVTLIASFGPHLTISGVATLPMPWKLTESIPGLDHALPGRFSVFVFMAVCVLVADAWARRVLPRWIVMVFFAFSALLMVPNLHAMGFPTAAGDERIVSSGELAHLLHDGDNVLVLPAGQNGPGMQWMDELDFSFTMPTGNGGGANRPAALDDPVAEALWDQNLDFDWANTLKPYLTRNDVDVVIVEQGKTQWRDAVESALGPPERVRGAWVWRVVPR